MGSIKVTVQTEERMTAITNLAIAIKNVSESLKAVPHVYVTGCTVNSCETGMIINTEDDVTETIIEKIDDDNNS